MGRDGDAFGRAVRRGGTPTRGRLFNGHGDAVSDVEGAHQVGHPEADVVGFFDREIPAGDRVERLHHKAQRCPHAEDTAPQSVLKLAPALGFGHVC